MFLKVLLQVERDEVCEALGWQRATYCYRVPDKEKKFWWDFRQEHNTWARQLPIEELPLILAQGSKRVERMIHVSSAYAASALIPYLTKRLELGI